MSGLRQLPHRRFGRFVWTLGLGLAFFAADLGLNRFAFSDGWSILWPLNGITLALLLMRPRSDWSYMLLGIAVGTGVGESLDPHPAPFQVLQRLISLTEILISVSLLPAFTTLDQWLRTTYIFRRFVAALLLGPGISGVLYALVSHHARHKAYLLGFYQWTSGDALGIAATMPLVLSLRSPELLALFRGRMLPKTIGILTAALGGAALSLSVSGYPLLFLLYPVLLLVDLVLAFVGSAVAVFGVCLMAVYLATHHYGPFGNWPAALPVSRDVALQLFLGFHILALFPASILILERRRMSQDLKAANVQLRRLASLDGLTGIGNRRALDERFSQEWGRSSRAQSPIALLMIDIDHFKQFNDRYGHHAGDQALQAVADALNSHMRRPSDLAARFGGEEFAVLLPNTDLAGAMHLAEAIRLSVLGLALPHSGSSWGVITASIGCAAASPLPGRQSYAPSRLYLLNAADRAMYQAKHSGRNCVRTAPLPDISPAEPLSAVQIEPIGPLQMAEACVPES